MSNILTSYVRIWRVDKSTMTQEEIDFLFDEIVRSYEEFGSYWVRIEKEYLINEHCLNIVFGSSKRFHTSDYILERKEIAEKYHIWERIADEGGVSDRLLQYKYDDIKGYVDYFNAEDCWYGFDTIRIIGKLPANFPFLTAMIKVNGSIELPVSGSYCACNSRSFVDIEENSKFYGPCIGYDPEYRSSIFIKDVDGLNNIAPPELKEFLVYPFRNIQQNDVVIELDWNKKVVKRIISQSEKITVHSADSWHNVLNRTYLKFKEKYCSL